MAEQLTVEVIYADEQQQVVRTVELPSGSSVNDAIDASRIGELISAEFTIDGVGIFGRKVSLDHTLANGDRVEIYRPLKLDPMEARRRRAR
jgi:uncharacterized protein